MGNDGLSSKQVRSQASRRVTSYSAAGLDPTCLHKHKCGSHTESQYYNISEKKGIPSWPVNDFNINLLSPFRDEFSTLIVS